MSIKKRVDELIDWYSKFQPEAGKAIPVCATASTVRKFAKKVKGGPFMYRDRVIVPIRKPKAERVDPVQVVIQ